MLFFQNVLTNTIICKFNFYDATLQYSIAQNNKLSNHTEIKKNFELNSPNQNRLMKITYSKASEPTIVLRYWSADAPFWQLSAAIDMDSIIYSISS